jgi:hypothetical protein
MTRDEVRTAVRTTLAVMRRIAEKTRTRTDDVMVTILQLNEERLVDAVEALLKGPTQPPTEEQIAAALASVGIST